MNKIRKCAVILLTFALCLIGQTLGYGGEGCALKVIGLSKMSSAKVIVSEAGGKITGFDNSPADGSVPDFVATNGTAIHEQVTALVT